MFLGPSVSLTIVKNHGHCSKHLFTPWFLRAMKSSHSFLNFRELALTKANSYHPCVYLMANCAYGGSPMEPFCSIFFSSN